MKITTEVFSSATLESGRGKWDVSFHGPHVDERESASSEFARKNSSRSISVDYSVSKKELSIDGTTTEDFSDLAAIFKIKKREKILVDATTLSVPELFFILRALKAIEVDSFDACYFEPIEYKRVHQINLPDGLCFINNYGLSDDFSGYVAIPGAAVHLSESNPHNIVFLTGFEGQRITRAFENQNILAKNSYSIVGIPPFLIGMELSNLSNNAKIFSEFTRKGIFYCPANNPYLAYRLIEKLYKSSKGLVVAPVGTKPHGLAAVLFCLCNKSVGLLYDHPEKSKDRSKDTGRLNIFNVIGLLGD